MPFGGVWWRWQAALAIAVALALRLFVAIHLMPTYVDDDGKLYFALADNLVKHGTYGLDLDGRLTAVDIRMPGYPLFLAMVRLVFGHAPLALSLLQGLVALLTCVAVAFLSAELSPQRFRPRVALAALWLAALCPFVAGYSVQVLTEVWAVFLTALALVALLVPGGLVDAPKHYDPRRALVSAAAAGLLVGFGTLVRPETPLLAVAALVVLALRCRRRRDWPLWCRLAGVMSLGLLLPLSPWVARNAIVLHEFRILAPRSAELPGEFQPYGFEAWTHTWLSTFRQVQTVSWKMESEAVDLRDLPAAAFDSAGERARIDALFKEHNRTRVISPQMDGVFAEIARERTRRNPLRTYLGVPLERAATLWFAERLEWLEGVRDPPWRFAFETLNGLVIAAAIAGAWVARRRPASLYLLTFIVVRTAFLTTAQTPEPRYVLECFPALLALAAQLWTVGRAEAVENSEKGERVVV